ncbi:MAG: LysE family translocator [Afipia sp.]|nr:LysE family translocator [Afipia sp.]
MNGLLANPLLAFAVTALVVELTPGPNMAYLTALSLSKGLRAGAAAVAGVALGLALSGFAAALGLAAIIDNSRILYEALRWGGVAYLLWLAWEGWSQERDIAATQTADADGEPRKAFTRSLMFNMLNPKAAIFYIAVLPEFVQPERGAALSQTVLLSAIYVAIATAVHLGIVLLAGSLQTTIHSPQKLRWIRKSLAVALAAIAVWFAFSTRR